jgi:hypothetical protein
MFWQGLVVLIPFVGFGLIGLVYHVISGLFYRGY